MINQLQHKDEKDCILSLSKIDELLTAKEIIDEVVEKLKNGVTIKVDDSSDLTIPRVRITTWEKTVLRLLVQGKTSKEIAYETDKAIGTIRNEISYLRKKLSMLDRGQLAIYAVVNGLVNVEDLSMYMQKKPYISDKKP